MRRTDQKQDAMFSYVSPEQRVPPEHPLRPFLRSGLYNLHRLQRLQAQEAP
jgi:hypothetical protein